VGECVLCHKSSQGVDKTSVSNLFDTADIVSAGYNKGGFVKNVAEKNGKKGVIVCEPDIYEVEAMYVESQKNQLAHEREKLGNF